MPTLPRRAVLLAALAFAISIPAAAPAPAQAPPVPKAAAQVAALIPDGPVTVEVLTPRYSPRMQEYSRRLINAAQSDPKWFQSWVAQHPRGPLPWHPKLGLARPEYEDYLREGRTAAFDIRSRNRLTFTRQGRAPAWRLTGWGPLGPLDGLLLDLQNNQASSPRWGVLPGMGISEPTDPNVPLAWRWYGVFKAAHQMGDPRKGGQAMAASLHVGPLGDGTMVGMYWSARRLNGGRRLADEFLLIRFPARR